MIENPRAFVFPGQGTQKIGMAEPLFLHRNPDIATITQRTFEEASDILQADLKSSVSVGPDEVLDRPGFTEPAILVTSIAALRALGYYNLMPDIVAGHSMGEYSALVAAEALSFAQAVNLVKMRGEFMERVGADYPGGMGMAAVLGLPIEKVEEICERTGAEVANINSDGQIVISGKKASLWYATEILGERRVKELRVSVASHSSLMEPAKRDMEILLDATLIKDPVVPFIQNTTADYAKSEEQVRRGLLDHFTGRVLWLDTIRLMTRDGVNDYVEVGPGEVLVKLIKRIDPNATVKSYRELIQP